MTRNITLSLPEDLIKKARIAAAERDCSVSALVGELLRRSIGVEDGYQKVWEREKELMTEGILTVGEITWKRESLHERN